MLPKKNRLSTRQFERSFKRSNRIKIGNYAFLISAGQAQTRCAVVVGKKISKSAVKRNRIRRQLYALIQKTILPSNPQKNIICLYHGSDEFFDQETFTESCHKLFPQHP